MFKGYRSSRARGFLILVSLLFWYAGPNINAQAVFQTRRTDNNNPLQTPANRLSPSNVKSATGQETEVVRVETDLTNVFFTAVDKHKRFVTTLRQEDVRVTEDGIQQEVFTFQRETDRPLSLVILIDTSRSQEKTLPDEKAAARIFVETVMRASKDEVAIVSFTGEATIEQDLISDVAKVRSAIDRVRIVLPRGYLGGGIFDPNQAPPPGSNEWRLGTTAIWDAIWATSGEVLSKTPDKTRRAIILLTDGVDTTSRLKRSEAIDGAIKAQTVVYSIGIGDSDNFEGIEKDTLRKLSERTGGRAYFPVDERDLRTAFAQIEQELRSQYLVAYSSTNKKRDGAYRQVKIEITNPEVRKQKLQLNYRQGYFANAPANVTSGK